MSANMSPKTEQKATRLKRKRDDKGHFVKRVAVAENRNGTPAQAGQPQEQQQQQQQQPQRQQGQDHQQAAAMVKSSDAESKSGVVHAVNTAASASAA